MCVRFHLQKAKTCSIHRTCACRRSVSVNKPELKDHYQAHRRRYNEVDPSLCLQIVPVTEFDAFPATACHAKPF